MFCIRLNQSIINQSIITLRYCNNDLLSINKRCLTELICNDLKERKNKKLKQTPPK